MDWKNTFLARFPQAHSEFGAVSLVDTTSMTADDYKLVSGSSGIDEGTAITFSDGSTFTDDYEGTLRPQVPWDSGCI